MLSVCNVIYCKLRKENNQTTYHIINLVSIPRFERADRENNHSSPCSTKYNEWSHTPLSPYAFMASKGTLSFTWPYMTIRCAVALLYLARCWCVPSVAVHASLHSCSHSVPGTPDNSSIAMPLRPHHFHSEFRIFGIPVKQASKTLLDVCYDAWRILSSLVYFKLLLVSTVHKQSGCLYSGKSWFIPSKNPIFFFTFSRRNEKNCLLCLLYVLLSSGNNSRPDRRIYNKFVIGETRYELSITVAYRGVGVWGGSNSLSPRNSEGPPKSCRTQTDCENC